MRPYICWPSGFSIAPNKLASYLLNVNGKSAGKVQWWLSQGFTTADLDPLIAVLHAHTSATNFVCIRFPQRYMGHCLIYEGAIDTPVGHQPIVRTVWQVDYATPSGSSGIARLITAHKI